MAGSSSAAAAGRFGKLWGRGFETFDSKARRILSVRGSGATTFLQGLVTSDLLSDPSPPHDSTTWGRPPQPDEDHASEEEKVEFNKNLRSTCFLDNKGRVLTDGMLWKLDENDYALDVPGEMADPLLSHLRQFKLRRTKVDIEDVSDSMSLHVIYGTLNTGGSPPEGYRVGLDPRHASLGVRVLSSSPPEHFGELMSDAFPSVGGTYQVLRKLSGVAEGSELQGKTALESNMEWLQAVSFAKGCYLGQELTARTQFTGVIRKRIMPIIVTDTQTQVPRPWVLAQQVQEGRNTNVDDNDGLDKTPLPQLSAASVGGLWTMMMTENGDVDDTNHQQVVQNAFVEQILAEAVPGTKILDTKDGKTIGQVISTPASGTSLLLAQMRLDRVGLLSGGGWSRTNRINFGGSKEEFRYLPFTPLWWPPIDPETGKSSNSQ